LVDYLFLAWW